VRPDQTLDIDLLSAETGSTVEFREVLLVAADGGGTTVGNPLVDGARVIAEVLEQGRDRKLMVFKYKNKTRYRRHHGHRRAFTRVAIRQILTDGQEPAAEVEKKPARKRPAPKPKAEPIGEEAEVQAVAEASAEVSQAEAEAKPQRAPRARKPAAPDSGAGATEAGEPGAPKPARRPRTKKTESEG
jgi:large subunit ribosomal protein L21